jgi:hypothetical protein
MYYSRLYKIYSYEEDAIILMDLFPPIPPKPIEISRFKYPLKREERELLFRKQKGICACCGYEMMKLNGVMNPNRVKADHNHETGFVRALVCNRCNHAIGEIELCRLKYYGEEGFIWFRKWYHKHDVALRNNEKINIDFKGPFIYAIRYLDKYGWCNKL